jgi:hypothetical protein
MFSFFGAPPFAKGAFVAWLCVASVVSAYLLAGHLITMPAPTASRIETPLGETPRADWSMTHVLSTECGCSIRVLEHLLATERPEGVRERILVLGSGHTLLDRLRAAGFTVEQRQSDRLHEELGVEAVPALLIADPEGRVVYSGGYTDRKQARRIVDLELYTNIREHREVKPLPLYGCAVSKKLRRAIDPLSDLTASEE